MIPSKETENDYIVRPICWTEKDKHSCGQERSQLNIVVDVHNIMMCIFYWT